LRWRFYEKMSNITQFRCILPPSSAGPSAGVVAASGLDATPAGMILRSLSPLREELNAALARDDRNRALTLAYTALSRVADALAAYRGDKLRPRQVRVHALLVELEILPLEPLPDGTMVENGTAVTINYRSWSVDHPVATAWAQTLTEHFQALWPGAWVVVGAHE
jgi:hypothetical protein